MKIRENLVSNSSSTSFIIAFKDSKPCPHCGRKDPNIVKLIETISNCGSSDQTCVEAVGYNDVKQFINSSFDQESKETIKIFKDIEKYKVKEDWNLATIKISYHDDELKTIYNNGIASGNIDMLYNSET